MPRVAGLSDFEATPPIASRQNRHVRAFRALARGGREAAGRLLIDGRHLLVEARRANLHVDQAAFTTEALAQPDVADVARALADSGTEILTVTPQVMTAISPVRASSGVVAIARRTVMDLAVVFRQRPQLVLLAVDVQDPGNIGALIRAAEAAGATGTVACGLSADPFGWKALRGSMGSAFRLPVAHATADEAVAAARAAGVRLVATVPRLGTPLFEADLQPPTAFLLGGEGPGLSLGLLGEADETVSIPMRAPVESLNVAVAAALLLYEAMRQRLGGRREAGE